MQHLEADAVPHPALAGVAGGVRYATGTGIGAQRVGVLQRRRQGRYGQPGQQRGGAADVVAVAMAEHQQIDAAFTAGVQQRQQDAASGIGLGRVDRAAVVDQQVVLRAHEHGSALAHVGRHHLEFAMARPRHRRPEQR